MDGAEQRRQRYARIAQKIQSLLYCNAEEHGKDNIPFKKTIVMFKVEMGLTAEKIKEYMFDLQELEQFEIDEVKDQIRKTNT